MRRYTALVSTPKNESVCFRLVWFCKAMAVRSNVNGSFAPNFGHDGALAAITKADTILEKAHDRKWVVSG